jgi:heme/copper-type cytochrome/quinol oxidase subunit 1
MTYLFVDHRYARDAFGGNTGILEWAGWIFTQPATFLFAIPVFGLLAELLPITFGRRAPGRGIVFAGLSLIGVSALAAVTQIGTFNMPWSGTGLTIDDGDDFEQKLRDALPFLFFNLLPVLGALLVLGFGLALAKPQKGAPRPKPSAAIVFAFFGAAIVFMGMVASVLHAIDDLDLQGTVYEEGVLMALVYGVALAVMGGVLHWSPKLTGRLLSAAKAAPLALLGAAGAVLASVPYFVAGFLDQPSLYLAGGLYDDSDLTVWNILGLIGHGLMALAALGFVGLVLQTRHAADRDDADEGTEPDPWGGQTLEWITTSPAPDDNYLDVAVVESSEPALDLHATSSTGGDE